MSPCQPDHSNVQFPWVPDSMVQLEQWLSWGIKANHDMYSPRLVLNAGTMSWYESERAFGHRIDPQKASFWSPVKPGPKATCLTDVSVVLPRGPGFCDTVN